MVLGCIFVTKILESALKESAPLGEKSPHRPAYNTFLATPQSNGLSTNGIKVFLASERAISSRTVGEENNGSFQLCSQRKGRAGGDRGRGVGPSIPCADLARVSYVSLAHL